MSMWFLMFYFIGVAFYWLMAVVYYNSKVSKSEIPDIHDFGFMIFPVLNYIGAFYLLYLFLRMDKIGISRIIFLNLRKK
jgi:hypothetical protein